MGYVHNLRNRAVTGFSGSSSLKNTYLNTWKSSNFIEYNLSRISTFLCTRYPRAKLRWGLYMRAKGEGMQECHIPGWCWHRSLSVKEHLVGTRHCGGGSFFVIAKPPEWNGECWHMFTTVNRTVRDALWPDRMILRDFQEIWQDVTAWFGEQRGCWQGRIG